MSIDDKLFEEEFKEKEHLFKPLDENRRFDSVFESTIRLSNH